MSRSVREQAIAAFAARAGLSESDLSRIRAGDPAPLANLQDPLPLLLLAASEGTESPGEERSTEFSALEGRAAMAESELASSREQLRRARDALASAELLAGYVARVFGTCRQCWGFSSTCPACAGAGGPGHQVPDRNELLHWVGPALERLGLRVVDAPHSGGNGFCGSCSSSQEEGGHNQ
jgi:hypothetical protein